MNPRDTLLAKLAMNVSLSSRREERAGPSPRRSGFVLAGRPPRADPLRPSDNGFGHAGGERRAVFIGFPLSLTLSPLLRRGERELTANCRVPHSPEQISVTTRAQWLACGHVQTRRLVRSK